MRLKFYIIFICFMASLSVYGGLPLEEAIKACLDRLPPREALQSELNQTRSLPQAEKVFKKRTTRNMRAIRPEDLAEPTHSTRRTDPMMTPVRVMEKLPSTYRGRTDMLAKIVYDNTAASHSGRMPVVSGILIPSTSELTQRYFEDLTDPQMRESFRVIAKTEGDGIAKILGLTEATPLKTDLPIGVYQMKDSAGMPHLFLRTQYTDGPWWFVTFLLNGIPDKITHYKVYLNLPVDHFHTDLKEILMEMVKAGAFGCKMGATAEDLARDDRLFAYFANAEKAYAFAKKMDAYLSAKGYPPGFPELTGRMGTHVSIGADRHYVDIDEHGEEQVFHKSHRKTVSDAIARARNYCDDDPECICRTFVLKKVNPVNYLPLEMSPVSCQ